MSEPIKLFDRDGNDVTRYSPVVAYLEVSAGLLFTERPNMFERGEQASEPADETRHIVDPDEGMPALDGMPQDDEPIVPMSKRGRPRKVTGQIL